MIPRLDENQLTLIAPTIVMKLNHPCHFRKQVCALLCYLIINEKVAIDLTRNEESVQFSEHILLQILTNWAAQIKIMEEQAKLAALTLVSGLRKHSFFGEKALLVSAKDIEINTHLTNAK